MGRFTFNLPDIGEGIAEAEIVAWHVKVGDRVEEDAQLADMMTDKATVEIPAPRDGTVAWLGGEVGEKIAVGAPLAKLTVAGEEGEETVSAAMAPAPERAAEARRPSERSSEEPAEPEPQPAAEARARDAAPEAPAAGRAARRSSRGTGDVPAAPGGAPCMVIEHVYLRGPRPSAART